MKIENNSELSITVNHSQKHRLIFLIIFFLMPIMLFSSTGMTSISMTHKMMHLVFQIGIIIFAAKFGGFIFEKIKMPSVLGELIIGIILGPYLLGSLPLPGFPHGIFGAFAHFNPLEAIPISTELYGLATMASILLLFMAGLETDLKMFLKFSLAGSLVGIGGVVFSFIIGDLTGVFFLKTSFMDPVCLFLGVMSTATSVGITARILSERRKMDSPEGVTILSGAVIDDVLGIILLAIVLGISATIQEDNGQIAWNKISFIALKALIVWLGFTIVGFLFAKKISSLLKKSKNTVSIAILSLGLALILSGMFELAGLAMIIGAYIMGLTLSKTDISFAIQETLHPIYDFLVPIFFTVSGMLVNPVAIFSKDVLIFGSIYTIGAILAKIIGTALPSFALKFNAIGALRIGLGMVPRGEVALIIAGIGLSTSILDEKLFGVSILMTLSTTVIAPPLLNSLLKNNKKGLNKDIGTFESMSTIFSFPSQEITEFVASQVNSNFQAEGFFINRLELDFVVFQIRKDDSFVTLTMGNNKLDFTSTESDVSLINNIVYEAVLSLHTTIEKLQKLTKPEKMRENLINDKSKYSFDFLKIIEQSNIIMKLKGTTKEEVLEELLDSLYASGKIIDRKQALTSILEREEIMSTGMQKGIALPHTRTEGTNRIAVAIGLKKDGIDFDSIDNLPSKLIFMIISPSNHISPHLQLLSGISSHLSSREAVEKLLKCQDRREIIDFFKTKKKK